MKRQIKVRYLSPDHLRYINPDLIDSVTLKNGSMVRLNSPKKSSQYYYRKVQNPGASTYYGNPKYMGQTSNLYGSSYVFRGGKKKVNEEGSNKFEIEVPEGGVQKEGLLTDILSGEGGYNPEDDQIANQGYYGDDQQETTPQEYPPITVQNPINDGYSEPNSYYPNGPNTTTNLDDAIRYPSSNPQGAQEEYQDPNLPNESYPPQDYPQQPEEQIPIQTPYIPVQPTPQQPEEQIPIQTPYIPVQPTPQQPEIPIQEPIVPIQPTQPYQQPTQPYQQPTQPYQQPTQPYQQPTQPYQQPTQPYQQPSQPQYNPYPYQQPMQPQPQYDPYPNQQPMQPIVPPQVIPASNNAKNNAPVKQTNNNTSAPKSFKELFKEAKKQAKNKIKKNTVFRARRKEVPEEEFCPYCNRSQTSYPDY
jgi:hypothetical protein